jgi:putative transposase
LILLIDKQFLESPFNGLQRITWHLQHEGYLVSEKRVRRLMRLMGLMPLYQKPSTSGRAKGHKTYPYLLRGCWLIRVISPGAQTSPTGR